MKPPNTINRPQPIAEILADLIARRGYAREQSSTALAAAWRQAVGDFLAGHTRCGGVRRGSLEVAVANSTLVQEITFRKQDLIRQLTQLLPDQQIVDLRLRVGLIE
jgi:hypothetical protein